MEEKKRTSINKRKTKVLEGEMKKKNSKEGKKKNGKRPWERKKGDHGKRK